FARSIVVLAYRSWTACKDAATVDAARIARATAHTDSLGTWQTLGDLYREQDKLAECEAALRHADTLVPDQPALANSLEWSWCLCLDATGRREEAIERVRAFDARHRD